MKAKTTRIVMAVMLAAILLVGGGFAIKWYLDSSPVVFNDPALERAVRSSLGISERPITHKEAEMIVEMDLSLMEGYNKEITDLTGLSAFRGVKKLNLANNMITDISVLGDLPGLEYLDVRGNPIDAGFNLDDMPESCEVIQ